MLQYRQVDVFASEPLAGNGLAVVVTESPLDPGFMQKLTCELRQFETIFLLSSGESNCWRARVFTMEEELPFAGHPSLEAAAVLHERDGAKRFECELSLLSGVVRLTSVRSGPGYQVAMNLGRPDFGMKIRADDEAEWLSAFGLNAADRDRRMHLCVASTGLPYLFVPVTSEGLGRAKIRVDDLERRLAGVGAKFVYVVDLDGREGRTWDNLGLVEDIATGSAAGPFAALLVRYGLAAAAEPIVVRQGRFVGRPSQMFLEVKGSSSDVEGVVLSGAVRMVARGAFDVAVGG